MKKHRSTEVSMLPPKAILNVPRYICKSCNTGWAQVTKPKYCPNCGRKVHRVYDVSKDPVWMAVSDSQKRLRTMAKAESEGKV